MIILINWWITEEPEVNTFAIRALAEDHIKTNLGHDSGNISNYDAYEGIQLEIQPDGTLTEVE